VVADEIIAGATVGLVLATAALVWTTYRLVLATRHLALVEKRIAQRARIFTDMDMYQDIAKGNRWEWSPWDVDERDSRYHDWDLWRERCIRYYPRIYDPTMKALYEEFVPFLRKQAGKERWGEVYSSLRKQADSRLLDLRAQLQQLDRVEDEA